MCDKSVVRSRRSKSGHWTLYPGYECPALVGAKLSVGRGAGDERSLPAGSSMDDEFLRFTPSPPSYTPSYLRSERGFSNDRLSVSEDSTSSNDRYHSFPTLRDLKGAKRGGSKTEPEGGDEDSANVSVVSYGEDVELPMPLSLIEGKPTLPLFGSAGMLDEFIRNITAIRDGAIAVRDSNFYKSATGKIQESSVPVWPSVRSRTVSEVTDDSLEISGPPERRLETKSSEPRREWPSLRTNGVKPQSQEIANGNAAASVSTVKGQSLLATPVSDWPNVCVPRGAVAANATYATRAAKFSEKKSEKGHIKDAEDYFSTQMDALVKPKSPLVWWRSAEPSVDGEVAPPEEWYAKRSSSPSAATCRATRPGGGDADLHGFAGDGFAVALTNLAKTTTWDQLKTLLSPFGQWLRLYVALDQSTGACRGSACVYFKLRADAAKAIKTLDGMRLRRQVICVGWS